jgi:hypothetical protein
MQILNNISIQLSLDETRRRLHMKQDRDIDSLKRLVDVAQKLMEPKAAYNICYIDEKLRDAVTVKGVRLRSRVLRKNLEESERIFPFVITLGPKLGAKQDTCNDFLEKFYLDTIGNVALNSVRKQLEGHLQSKYGLNKIASMAPGSLSDWPIEEQKPLFKLLGDVESAIGVKLNPNLLMLPAKSVSGIYFPTEVSFYSCQLCPRKRCESRKAKYDKTLAGDYGIEN